MIIVKETNIEMEGKENVICGKLGIIFNTLIEEIGERRTKRMINIALHTVIEENRKRQIKDKKDLKARIQRDLPKEISDILCSLI